MSIFTLHNGRDLMQGIQCDAEIGRAPNWHACKRKPKWRIKASSGQYLEYCDQHKNHADKPECMIKSTFAELQPL